MLQGGGIDMRARPRETLRQYASFHADPRDPDELLDLVGLRGVADTRYRRLSGGERQRLGLALALVGRPEVVLLDEPTAGMDPEGRAATRRIVADLRDEGVAILLTSHDLADVERLADRIAILVGRAGRRRGHARRARRGPPSAAAPALRAPADGRPGRGAWPPRRRPAAAASSSRRTGTPSPSVPPTPGLTAAIAAWAASRGAARRRIALGGRLARGRLPRPGRRRHERRRHRGHGPPSRRSRWRRRLTSRRGENLLALIGIPVAVLLFFGSVDLVPVPAGQARIDVLLPGTLALAVIAAGLVNLGIATAYERAYGVLKRLGGSPLGRTGLIAAKLLTILAIEVLVVLVLMAIAVAVFGWRPGPARLVAAVRGRAARRDRRVRRPGPGARRARCGPRPR